MHHFLILLDNPNKNLDILSSLNSIQEDDLLI